MPMKVCQTLTRVMPHGQYASLFNRECVYIAFNDMTTFLFPGEAIVQSQRQELDYFSTLISRKGEQYQE